jgi:hypothetical protein
MKLRKSVVQLPNEHISDKVEIKLKNDADVKAYIGWTNFWEMTPVFKTIRAKDEDDADRKAQKIASQQFPKCQVRWNWQGSLQGHYVEAESV